MNTFCKVAICKIKQFKHKVWRLSAIQTLTCIPTLYLLADHKIYHFQILWENTKHWEDIRPHIHVTYSGILLHTTEDQEHM